MLTIFAKIKKQHRFQSLNLMINKGDNNRNNTQNKLRIIRFNNGGGHNIWVKNKTNYFRIKKVRNGISLIKKNK